MARPGKYDLALYRGDSYAWEFKLWDDEAKTDPTDLSGVTAKAQIRESTEAPAATELVCSITMPNTVKVSMPAVLWSPTTPKTGVWDLQLTYGSGEVMTVLAGAVTATADVTKV